MTRISPHDRKPRSLSEQLAVTGRTLAPKIPILSPNNGF